MKDSNRKNRVVELYSVLLGDIVSISLAYGIALLVRYHSFARIDNKELYQTTYLCLLLFCVLYHSVIDAGRDFLHRGYYVEFMIVLKFTLSILVAMLAGLFVFKQAEFFSRLVWGYFIAINGASMYLLHFFAKHYLKLHYRTSKNNNKVMVITDFQSGEKIIPLLKKESVYSYDLAAASIVEPGHVGEIIDGIKVVADGTNLVEVAKNMALDEVFIYLPEENKKVVEKIIMDFEAMGVICHYNIDVVDLDAKVRSVGEFAGFTVVTYALNNIDYRHRMIKRAMDIVGGLIGLIIVAVFFPFVALAIKIESKGPILFSQERVGKNGRKFKIYKFRSMYLDAEARKKELESQNEMKGLMFKMKDDPRVTKVGKFIRKTSIDELPQFYNVVKGDMSLVGTRPPTVDEFEKYTPYYRRRLCMTPGLTGLWQVSGRSSIENFDDVVKYDLHYIDYWSLSLDVKIILQTIFVVIFGKGAK